MKTFILLLAAGAILAGESICGKKFYAPTPEIHEAQVVCVDFPALARIGLPIPPAVPAQTQVVITLKLGRGVEATLNGQERIAKAYRAPDGSLSAVVSFDGMEHTELPKLTVLVAASDKL